MTAEIAPCRYQDSDDIKSLAWDTYKETALAKDRLDEYPSGVTVNTTRIEKDFGMGTALRPFHSGIQSDSLHIMYKKDDIINTVFTKYSVNNKVIGGENYNEWLDCGTMPCLDDEGRKFGLQSASTSLLVLQPDCRLFSAQKEESWIRYSLTENILQRKQALIKFHRFLLQTGVFMQHLFLLRSQTSEEIMQ